MSSYTRDLVGAVIAFGALLLPMSPAVSLESLAVYEDWRDGVIDSRRWQGGEGFGGQEVQREVVEVTRGVTMLELRYRLEGFTSSNMDSFSSEQFLNPTSPTPITSIEAMFTVSNLGMTTCAANNAGAATQARPARLLMAKFNDGTSSGPGDRTGDHRAGIQAVRSGSSADPVGVLTVEGFIARCTNASCGTSSIVISSPLATRVSVGQPFTLRLQWDRPNRQFLFSLNGSADTALPYAASDAAPPINQFVGTNVGHTTANCTAGAVEIDSTTLVGAVRTNLSGLVGTFADVPGSHVFFAFIEALVDAGITGGCSASPPMYCADAELTRSQMTVFLLRGIHGASYQPPGATGAAFSDVPITHPFAAWIEEFARATRTGPCSTTNPPQYCPEAGVTRGQMAVLLLRAKHGAGYQPPNPIGTFTDVLTTHPFAAWVEQLAREGITAGCGPTTYCPDTTVTRGQVAVFLVRTFNLRMVRVLHQEG